MCPFCPLPSRRQIATGRYHSLALLSNGDVYACGGGDCGQLGLGDSKAGTADHPRFTRIPTLRCAQHCLADEANQ